VKNYKLFGRNKVLAEGKVLRIREAFKVLAEGKVLISGMLS